MTVQTFTAILLLVLALALAAMAPKLMVFAWLLFGSSLVYLGVGLERGK